jgi:malate dehydrogenase
MAYAAALFADACLRGMNGATATECTYVESDVTDLPFFATKVKLGTEGETRRCSCACTIARLEGSSK